jgi:hypothetical protein
MRLASRFVGRGFGCGLGRGAVVVVDVVSVVSVVLEVEVVSVVDVVSRVRAAPTRPAATDAANTPAAASMHRRIASATRLTDRSVARRSGGMPRRQAPARSSSGGG